jgi:uncharacterized protein YndB with AHSA1/START domain
MSDTSTDTRSVVVERELPHPPEKIWRALTEPHLIAEWLMQGDFRPVVGHAFSFGAEWGSVDCRVIEIEPQRMLAYSWGDYDLDSIVTWTLTPTGAGTRLRMEQSGFRTDQPRYFGGARAGWPRFIDRLEVVVAALD